MTFLNATLLLGTIAATVPIILHLLARQQPQRVVFPSIQFLANQMTTQQSRLRIRRWWLLAMRIAAMVAFALALARPVVSAQQLSVWSTLAIIAIAGVLSLIATSVAWGRDLGKRIAWGLLIAGVSALVVFALGVVRAIATADQVDVSDQTPIALALVIDNGPTGAVEFQGDVVTASDTDANEPFRFEQESWRGTRFEIVLKEAMRVMDRLADGSRIAIVDLSKAPVGFSLDRTAAVRRLATLQVTPNPVNLSERVIAARQLLQTSDLSDRHVVVISDMARATWDEIVKSPENQLASTQSDAGGFDVSMGLLHVGQNLQARTRQGERKDERRNRSLGIPRVDRTSLAPGIPIPVSVDISIQSPSDEQEGAASNTAVELLVYQRDPALPVIRNSQRVLPELRRVDRASVNVASGVISEAVMTLPPLPQGTYHAVIQLVGRDRFAWDDRRFLTVELPEQARVLLVGEEPQEMQILAAALTAPYAVDDNAAAYRIDRVGYQDLRVVTIQEYQIVVLIDPPIRVRQQTGVVLADDRLFDPQMSRDFRKFVQQGGGLMVCLGPSTQVVANQQSNNGQVDPSLTDGGQADEDRLLPPIVRSWRIPEPGTFWRVTDAQHPIFAWSRSPSVNVNWSDYRVRRYWQLGEVKAPWRVQARYARGQDNGQAGHPAIVSGEFGLGQMVVLTTPLPALSKQTRDWNDLFSSGDAWPAFVTLRSTVAMLARRGEGQVNLIVGQTGVLPVPDRNASSPEVQDDGPESSSTNTESLQLYAPTAQNSRPVSIDPQTRSVLVGECEYPGTYFVRGREVWSGCSANLDPRWSSAETIELGDLRAWGKQHEMPVASHVDELNLSGNAGSTRAAPLFAPLMLLAALAYLAEQLLSNRFYGGRRSESMGQPLAGGSR